MSHSILKSLCATVIASGAAAPAVAQTSPAILADFTTSTAVALEAIAQGCIDEGQSVTAHNAKSVTCEVTLARPERIAARVLLRAPFAHSPNAFVRFDAEAKAFASSLVRITGWVEDAPAITARRTVSLAGKRFNERLGAFVTRIGGRPSSV